MKAIITGAKGQLGWELQRTAPAGWRVFPFDLLELDICDRPKVLQAVKEITPDVIINAAAYNAVDKAESEPERAMAVNGEGPANLAVAVREYGGLLLHVSTDFVFDGRQKKPYLPGDQPQPLGAYGASKLKGEQNILTLAGPQAAIIRTAWLYSAHGQNFVKTMLRLMRERDELSVVMDQVGSPTWARELAGVLWLAAERPEMRGVCHWTDAGEASWYDFAEAIHEEALALGILQKKITIKPVSSAQYSSPARRPAYSVLDTMSTSRLLGYHPAPWRENLRKMLREIK